MKLRWERTIGEGNLPSMGDLVASELQGERFCLWLEGPMGAGKTSLCRYILQALGLSPLVPVQSPTYSIMNEYEVQDKLYAHLDLYRIDGDFDVEDLGLVSERKFTGLFVEWPSKVEDELLVPSHLIKITKGEDLSNFN